MDHQLSSNNPDQDMDMIARGRTARRALVQITPVLDQFQHEKVQFIAINGHQLDDNALRHHVGQLSALFMLRQRLENEIKQADAKLNRSLTVGE